MAREMSTVSRTACLENHGLSLGVWVVASFALFLVVTGILRGLGAVSPLISAALALSVAGLVVWWSMRPSRGVFLVSLLTVGLLGLIAVLLGASVRDISYDGQAIHIPSALEIANGLNPLTARSQWFFSTVYPNGLWTLQGLFISLAPWFESGLEAGKAPAWLLAFASMPLIAVAMRQLRGAWTPAVALAAVLVQANPVMLLQLTSFELDGVVYSLVVIAIAGAILLPTRHHRAGLVVLCGAILLLINSKITGLYWAGLIGLVVVLQAALDQRRVPVRLGGLLLAVLAVSLVIVGWRPYLAIPLETGQVFGTTTDVVTGPLNLRDAGAWQRMTFLVFGKSSNPVAPELAQLKWPGQWSADEFVSIFDIRIGGFGSWFGVQVLGVLLVGGVALWQMRRSIRQDQAWLGPFWTLAVFTATLLFPVSWWARLVSPFWLVAVLPLVWRRRATTQADSRWAWVLRLGWTIAIAGVLVNGAALTFTLKNMIATNGAITQILSDVAVQGSAVRIVPGSAPEFDDGTPTTWQQRLIQLSISPRVGPVDGCRQTLFAVGSVQLCIENP